MEFMQIKEWKEKELEGFRKAKDYYIEHSKELEEEDKMAKDRFFRAVDEYKEKHGDYPTKQRTYRVVYDNKEIDELYLKKENAHYDYIDFTYNKNQFYHDYAYSSKFDEEARKQIDKHFDTLQVKVEKKIGTIKEISPLGGDDYRFIGTDGECKVEVIWAGGYNIQRLHTRWIIKK